MNSFSDKMITCFDRAMAGSFYGLIFFLPISNAMVETFTVLALLSYLIKRSIIFARKIKEEKSLGLRGTVRLFLKSFAPPANALNKPIAIWMGVCLFSVLISERPSLSFDAFLGKVLQSAFLFFNFIEAIRTRKRVNIFLTFLFCSTFLVCLSGINQYFLGMDFIRNHVLVHHRINSTFRAPNDFAAFLVMVIPILLSCLALKAPSFRGNRKLIIGMIGALAVVCLGLTYSRGGWLSIGIALIMFSLLHRAFYKRVLLGTAAFMVIFILKMVKERDFMAFQHLFRSFGRTTYWHEALNIIAAKPIFGFGLNTYSIVVRRFKEGWGGYPHNCYLQMTAELGMVGLAAFLWILVRLYKGFFQALKRTGDLEVRALLVGTASGFTGFLIHSAFDTFFYSVQLGSLMWIIMGLLIRLIAIEET